VVGCDIGRVTRSSILLALVVLAACTSRAGQTDGTVTEPVPDICVTVTGLPFPERRGAIAAEGDPEDVLRLMRSACPQVVETIEALEVVVEASSNLDDDAALARAVADFTCEANGITVPFLNPFDHAVRLVVTGRFLDGPGDTVAAAATVSEPISPDASGEVFVPLAAPPGSVDCAIEAQPFLVTDSAVTDTWDATLGLGPPLPQTDGDDWLTVLSALVAAEIGVESTGEWTASGSFEDVRSKNYGRLVASDGAGDTTGYEIRSVCRARTVTDGLAMVVYEFATPEVELALGAGVFIRSPDDGRWRWAHTAMLLDVGGGGCGLLGGFEVV
jgi:hypothetical protein